MEVRCEFGIYCIGQNEEVELCFIGIFQLSYIRISIIDCINCIVGVYICGIFEDQRVLIKVQIDIKCYFFCGRILLFYIWLG